MTLVEEGVTSELDQIVRDSEQKYDAASEYLMIKSLFIKPMLSQMSEADNATESTT